MSGYAYGDHEPAIKCPYCQTRCTADFVDVGVGMLQCGPYHCDNCLASEIGPYDKTHNPFKLTFAEEPPDPRARVLTKQESDTGWYAPDSPPGSSANVIGGKVVSHVQMRDTYRDEFLGNPLHEDQSYIDKWWEDIRESTT